MTQLYQGWVLTDAQADRIGKLRIHNDVSIVERDLGDVVYLKMKDHGSNLIDRYALDGDGRLRRVTA